MLTFLQAAALGVLQGMTELFPISSLGHTVILPAVLRWPLDQNDPLFLAFVVATHFATALVLLAFFFRDWVGIVKGIFRSLFALKIAHDDTFARLGWLLVLGTIPAGALGFLFQHKIQDLFASPRAAALLLALNGAMLFGAELLRRRRVQPSSHDDKKLSRISWKQTLGIGCLQCMALLPGFSRTGSTITGGLLAGLDHEDAARFSFLLATPLIFAASALKLPDLFHAGARNITVVGVGFVCAALAAYFSVRFLSRYFKTRTLMPFAAYCILAGLSATLLL